MTTTAPQASADAGTQAARRDTENQTEGMPHLTTYAWDSRSFAGRAQRLVIAAASEEEACASAGIKPAEWRGVETEDAREIAVAIENPGVLFWRYVDGGRFFSWQLPARPIGSRDSYTHADTDDRAVGNPMDAVRNAWPNSVAAPASVQIHFDQNRTTVTAVLSNEATMTMVRFHDVGQGHYDQISHSGDWSSARKWMVQVGRALEKGMAAHRSSMARAAV